MARTKNDPKSYRQREIAARALTRPPRSAQDRGTTFFNGPVKNGFLVLRKPSVKDEMS